MKKILIIVAGVVVVGVLIVLNLRSSGGEETVQVDEVERRDVVEVVTASGNIQPKRRVNVSASAIGKVTDVAVVEGQYVAAGDFLLQIDPLPYESAVEQYAAATRGAEATLELERAALAKSEVDLSRAVQMHEKGFLSEDELRDIRVGVEIARARVKTARESLSQQRASLERAQHDLDRVRITAEMAGVITALNVEEGESAIMGTINNPGTVLLTIADLSEMEAQVKVDETEVVQVRPGQEAVVRLDAFPDTTFAGVVSEVGNSAMRSLMGLGQESVDFKVVVTITDSFPDIRPGLSASVDITVASVEDALTVPIQCLTVRDEKDLASSRRPRRGDGGEENESGAQGSGEDAGHAGDDTTAAAADDEQSREIEGVFVVEDGAATFRRVTVGIAGERYFEVIRGLGEGEAVISGPFRALNELEDGDAVKVRKKRARRERS